MLLNLPQIHLPKMDTHLGKFPSETACAHFKELTSALNDMCHSQGKGDQFKKRWEEILLAVEETNNLIDEVQTSRDIRVVVCLWRERNKFIVAFPVSHEILRRFRKIRMHQEDNALYDLTMLFFERFDDCGDTKALTIFLREEFRSRDKFYNDSLKKMQKQVDAILVLNGPEKIVKFSIDNERPLKDVIQMVGIPEGQTGKYLDVCKQLYYLETLKQLEMGENSDIFDELSQENVARMPYNNKWLGHEVISIMIQKGLDSGVVLPDNWLQVILKIADDPRVAYHREWWSLIARQYIEAMQGWLAGFDLELFLKALKNFSESSGDASLQRMFPARERFLKGLLDHKLIRLSKLFIGREPARYIKSLYDQKNMPKFSRLTDSDLSVIYLKVGHIHMVEGSHSFSLRLYDELPDRERLLNYSRTFRGSELGPRLAEMYERKSQKAAFSVTHNPNLTWQHKVIQEFGKQGVSINPEWVLTPDDYRDYRRKYGA